ncbi:MAG: hypothetical protein SNH79_04865 [Rikenellaceae bacterium]
MSRNRALTITLVTLGWILALGLIYILYEAHQDYKSSVTIDKVYIEIVEGAEDGKIVTVEMVEKLLSDAQIVTTNIPLNSLSLLDVMDAILQSEYVEQVNVNTRYNGDLIIKVWPRYATARLLLDGYDCYLNSRGYIFAVPEGSAMRTHVVTGSYKPMFTRRFSGQIDDIVEERCAKIDEAVAAINESMEPVLERHGKVQKRLNYANNRYSGQGQSEPDDVYQRRIDKLRAENAAIRDSCSRVLRVVDRDLNALLERRRKLERERYDLYGRREDIYHLAAFVEVLRADSFWNEEVIQINAATGSHGEITVSLSLRSTKMKVNIGSISPRAREVDRGRGLPLGSAEERAFDDQLRLVYDGDLVIGLTNDERANRIDAVRRYSAEKLRDMRRVYNEILPRSGWDAYSEIALEYDGIVVCTHRRRR